MDHRISLTYFVFRTKKTSFSVCHDQISPSTSSSTSSLFRCMSFLMLTTISTVIIDHLGDCGQVFQRHKDVSENNIRDCEIKVCSGWTKTLLCQILESRLTSTVDSSVAPGIVIIGSHCASRLLWHCMDERTHLSVLAFVWACLIAWLRSEV